MKLDQKGKVLAEYIWIDGTNGLRNKTKVSIPSWFRIPRLDPFCMRHRNARPPRHRLWGFQHSCPECGQKTIIYHTLWRCGCPHVGNPGPLRRHTKRVAQSPILQLPTLRRALCSFWSPIPGFADLGNSEDDVNAHSMNGYLARPNGELTHPNRSDLQNTFPLTLPLLDPEQGSHLRR